MPPENNANEGMPLAGLRVLDVGQFIAAPVCGALLADLGADVIRLEQPQGNADRYVTPLSDSMPDIGAMYSFANRNKRSLAVDFRADDARGIVERLILRSDVVVANMPQVTLEKLGLDLDSLRKINPDIVLSNTSAYGTQGPWKDRPGFDGMAQAMSGAMYLSGKDGEPMKSYVHFVDYYVGALSAVGVLATLFQRVAGGSGGMIGTSLLSSAMMMMNSVLAEEAVLHTNRVGTGNRAQTGGPADVFKTRDGSIILQVLGNPKFAALCQLLGEEQLISDPRFASDNLRGENSAALNEYVKTWCARRTSDECVDALNAAKLCASPVLTPTEALLHPQVAKHASLHTTHYDDAGINVPVFLPIDTGHERAPTPAPRLGQHSLSILGELGYSSVEIDGFVASGLVGAR